MSRRLGLPRAHLRRVDSTNARARTLAEAGAPHGTLVTAAEQTAGRGRQGRAWTAPAGRALLASLVLYGIVPTLPLTAALAVADVAADRGRATIKWPNDVLLDGRKVAGILVEARPAAGWAVLGIGLNVAVRTSDLPTELRDGAGSLGLEPAAIEPTLAGLLRALERRLAASDAELLAAYRSRDALRGRAIAWDGGAGIADGIDDSGRLRVVGPDGARTSLGAGEVHLRGEGRGTAP